MDEKPVEASYWSRLPPEFRREIREKRSADRDREQSQIRDIGRFRLKYGLLGAILGSVINLAQGPASTEFRLLMFIACGLIAAFVAVRRMGQLAGIVFYGGSAIGVSVAGFATGSLGFHGTASFGNALGIMFAMLAWILFLVTGGFLAVGARLEHDRGLNLS